MQLRERERERERERVALHMRTLLSIFLNNFSPAL